MYTRAWCSLLKIFVMLPFELETKSKSWSLYHSVPCPTPLASPFPRDCSVCLSPALDIV